MTHKQAQQSIISAGDKVALAFQRGTDSSPAEGAWKPSVQLVGSPATAQTSDAEQTYTKTSLKLVKPEVRIISKDSNFNEIHRRTIGMSGIM